MGTLARIFYCSETDHGGDRSFTPFPARSTGFLYYRQEALAAPLEGSIRFRVTSNNAPLSFQHGRDLRLPSGSPWQITLPRIACAKGYSRISEQLLDENLVTQKTAVAMPRHFWRSTPISGTHLNALHVLRLESPFRARFETKMCAPWTGTNLKFLAQQSSEPHVHLLGSALACFEPSTSPRHAGRRVLQLRITKIVKPVTCTIPGYTGRILRPEEGQLLKVRHRGAPEPWTFDIDSKRSVAAAALRVYGTLLRLRSPYLHPESSPI
ncbi:hypothetical protein B0H13DRAFT_1715786 [Mycena leptocephala]|nr:hypothetical protein B0H13DRAFT_1715786 [Mycena leptocephala]